MPRALLVLALVFAGVSAVSAGGNGGESGASPWAGEAESRVRLIAAQTGVGDGKTLKLGFQFSLQPGWKIYWRSPGDAGLPPEFDWSGSENLAATEVLWPAPKRYSAYGLDSIGYENEVILPVVAELEFAGQPLNLKLRLDYLICKDVCIPRRADLALMLPKGPAGPTSYGQEIARYLEKVPGRGNSPDFGVESVEAIGSLDKPRLRVVARSTVPFEETDVFIEGPRGNFFKGPELELYEGDSRAVFDVPLRRVGKAREESLIGKTLTVTLVADGRALETRVIVTQGAGDGIGGGGFIASLLLALLGGLILNLMPCVLPVLSLKLLGAVGHGGREKRLVRLSFLESAAGIYFSFLALATLAVLLRQAGHSVGWGIQFQQPLFLISMALVLVLFAGNLWGFFEIRLPGWMGDLAMRTGARTGARKDGHHPGAHFLTGAFATLLATPCSAPFLGPAIGYALSRGMVETYAIFLALGLGFSAPYLVVALRPELATRLPRPGPWMAVLRRILGIALAATALWLLTVLAAQISLDAAALVALLLSFMVLVLWGKSRLPRGAIVPILLVLGLLALLVPGRFAEIAPPVGQNETNWGVFSRQEIPVLVGQGRVVLVDVTADWCITCQVNKKLVLDRGEVAALLDSGAITALRADWTRPDDRIAAYLATFGRYGIPFNAVYGPAAPAGIALGELLTEGEVMDAIRAASGK
ncbi:MAG: copper-binding protein [Rhodospirillaceae bacterium]|nr:copper-binding protein [Rhodospirillaceae bacterium]MBT5752311.1 copper-binding protein [Rhodospirillaceae bacterium]